MQLTIIPCSSESCGISVIEAILFLVLSAYDAGLLAFILFGVEANGRLTGCMIACM